MRDNNKILEGGKEKYENSKFIMASYGTREMFGQWVTAAFGSSVFFFYEVRIGLDVGIAALALVLFSIWNSINDPFIGYIMERFHMPWEKKWGIRRFPWIIIGGIPWLFSFWFIFMVPLDWDPVDNQWQIFLWLLFSLCLYDIFFTIFDVNAISLYPEKFRGQKERRTAQGFGTILGIVGLVLSFIIFPSFLTEDPASYPRAASVTVVIGFFIFFMILPGVFENKKIRDEYSQRKNKIKDKKVESFLSSAKIVLKDRIFMVKVLFFFGYQAAVGLIQASALYMVIFILGDTEESFSFTILMAAMLVGALITVPIWLSISNKQKNNKKMGLIAGFVMFVSFLPMFFMTEIIGMSLCLILFGAGLGGQWFMNPPMMGDVLDDIALRTGNRKQSIYYGYQAFFIRLGGIFQGVIFAIVHILTNFVEGAESLEELQLLSSTPELAVLGIRIHATLIPALVVLITTLLFWKFYDLTPEKVETNREKLKELGI